VSTVVERDAVDVAVIGTGAAGLTAAFTAAHAGASVALFEKSELIGGTSAWSGGGAWIPGHPHQREAGVEDSPEQAFEYLMSLSRGMLEERLVQAFLDAGPEVVTFLDAHAHTEFMTVTNIPDYHPERPGGKPGGGRGVACALFSFDELGEWRDRVTASPYSGVSRLTTLENPLIALEPVRLSAEEIARREREDLRGAGQALIGRLLKAVLDAGVVPEVGMRGRELPLEDGRVTGVFLEHEGCRIFQPVDKGVVLANGGFEWNEDYCRAFLRGPMTHPLSTRSNTGDGLYMAIKAGAMLSNMREAWWAPAADLPAGMNDMDRSLVNTERSRPRSIMVNKRGRRFTNEAANYTALGGAFHTDDVTNFEYANLPCWLIFDQEYLRRYGTIGPHPPGEQPPGWLTAYPTLLELAADLGIDAGDLVQTVERWNEQVAGGSDPDFGRGSSAHDRWWGDVRYRRDVRGTLGPLDEAPFYAIGIHSGALGTKGGPRVDPHARVLDVDGEAIAGLYAAGNVMGSPFGATYGGAGGTLGPAIVFGYLAGSDVAAR